MKGFFLKGKHLDSRPYNLNSLNSFYEVKCIKRPNSSIELKLGHCDYGEVSVYFTKKEIEDLIKTLKEATKYV